VVVDYDNIRVYRSNHNYSLVISTVFTLLGIYMLDCSSLVVKDCFAPVIESYLAKSEFIENSCQSADCGKLEVKINEKI